MEYGRTWKGDCSADKGTLEGTLADFLWLEFLEFLQPCVKTLGRGGRGHIYGRQVLCRHTLTVIACSEFFLVATAEPHAQTFLRHRLAANLARLSKIFPSHQPIRLYLHTPHVYYYWLRPL